MISLLPIISYTYIHHRIQLAVGDMTMSGWKPTISLIHPPTHQLFHLLWLPTDWHLNFSFALQFVTQREIGSTVKSALRDHCHERPLVLMDHYFLAESPTFQCKWTCHQRPPVRGHAFLPNGGSLSKLLYCFITRPFTIQHTYFLLKLDEKVLMA